MYLTQLTPSESVQLTSGSEAVRKSTDIPTYKFYHNLKENRIANSPSFEVTEKLWIPRIIFDNTRNNDVMALDDLAKITISKEGKSTPSDETNVDEIEIFKGSENKIYFEKGFTKTVK